MAGGYITKMKSQQREIKSKNNQPTRNLSKNAPRTRESNMVVAGVQSWLWPESTVIVVAGVQS